MSSQFFHLISSHPIVLFSPHVTWACLISSHLISAHISIPQLFSTLLSSPQLMSAHLADFSSCQLVSPHLISFQHTLKSSQLFSGPKPAPKTGPSAKASDPYAFYREVFAQRSLYTAFSHSKLSHRESPAQKSFTQSSFYPQQAFAHSKPLHTASLEKLLHREAFTHRSFFTEQAFTQRSPCTEKHLHREAFKHRSIYTEKLLRTPAAPKQDLRAKAQKNESEALF